MTKDEISITMYLRKYTYSTGYHLGENNEHIHTYVTTVFASQLKKDLEGEINPFGNDLSSLSKERYPDVWDKMTDDRIVKARLIFTWEE